MYRGRGIWFIVGQRETMVTGTYLVFEKGEIGYLALRGEILN